MKTMADTKGTECKEDEQKSRGSPINGKEEWEEGKMRVKRVKKDAAGGRTRQGEKDRESGRV